MKKLLMTAAMGVALAACSYEPETVTICEDVYFSGKLGEEVEQRCSTYLQTPSVQAPVAGDNGDTLPTPTDVGTTPPDGPEDEPETPSDSDGDTDGDTDADTDTPDDTSGTGGGGDSDGDSTVSHGNPGNSKPVGNAGEKVAKGMDENNGSGSRGNSTRNDN